jgi:trigger factor
MNLDQQEAHATTVTEIGPFERMVKFEITDQQIDEAKKGAARKLAQEVKIHGFRPGKAPLPVVEATLGLDRLRREAIDDLVHRCSPRSSPKRSSRRR